MRSTEVEPDRQAAFTSAVTTTGGVVVRNVEVVDARARGHHRKLETFEFGEVKSTSTARSTG